MAADRLLGHIVAGRYRLEAVLAQGGMGRIYRATQLALGRQVAVKVLLARGDLLVQQAAAQRFVFEAAAAARLHHPHSVTVLDYGTEPSGLAYLVMELLHGRTLGQLLRHEGRLQMYRALTIVQQAAEALSAAHAQNIVHQDLKPSNLFLYVMPQDAVMACPANGQDFVKVVDYGLAKAATGEASGVTVSGRFLGSPGYMAPEQIRGLGTDHRCDIYALGAILFEMLTGSMPHVKGSIYETMVAQVREPLPSLAAAALASGRRLNFASSLEQLVQRAMAKLPEERFASMAELHREIDGVLQEDATAIVSRRRVVLHRVATARPDTWVEVNLQRRHHHVSSRLHLMPPQRAESIARLSSPARLAAAVVPLSWRLLGKRAAAVVAMALLSLGLVQAAALSCKYVFGGRGHGEVWARLASDPQGASVWLGPKQLCQATPCEVRLRWPLLRRHISLRFVHPNFDEFVTTQKFIGQQLSVRAQLDDAAKQRHEHLDQDQRDDGDLDAHGLL